MLSSDFKVFNPVSDIYPEKAVIWYSSELINYITLDKIKAQGVLYKPEGFSPIKKYPLIIHYYDKKSDELNQSVTEKVAKIESYTKRKDYYKFDEIIENWLKEKKKEWGQETIAYSYNNKLFFV